MTQINKTVRLGVQRPEWTQKGFNTYCRIKFDDGRLSISGVQGPLISGNARGSCGQIRDSLSDFTEYAPGWSPSMIKRFRQVWKDWHLNDCTAGSPKQEAFLRDNPIKAVYPDSHYDLASKALADVGLNPDDDYKYGSAWLTREVPDDVIAYLAALPDTDKTPAWV